MKVVAAMEAGVEGLSDLVQDLAVYFYADDIIFLLTQSKRPQKVFDVLKELFYLVGL